MVTGISSGPWGYSTANVAGLRPAMEIGYHPLTYEESLTSYPPSFNRGRMISPVSLANRTYYSNFGKKNIKININKCRQFLESNGTINPLSGRKIIIYGPTWKYIMDKCVKYSLIKEPSLSISSLPVNYKATKNGNVTNKLFIGNMPESPEQRNKNEIVSLPAPRGFKVTPDNIYLNGKTFNINDVAKIYADGTVGTIIRITPKQIILSKPNTLSHRHLKYKEFKELNK